MSLSLEMPGTEGSVDAGPRAGLDTLKILIVSTPKTGNTWLKLLLSEIYSLPVADPPANFREQAAGERWIGHQHYLPESELIEWAREAGVVCLTTVRHPGDVLVSLRHYVALQNTPSTDEREPASMLRDGAEGFGEHTRRYVEEGFFVMLHASIAWSRGGWARVVRYEDLWRDPVGTLKRLTDEIVPVPRERIEAAVEACELNRMRRRFPEDRRFYRKGGAGDWARVLPAAVRRALERDPYPAQFVALGYPPLRGERNAAEPFFELRRSWRMLRALPLVIRIWRKLPVWRQTRWLDAARGSEASLGWVNRPAAEDERMPARFPVITKLAIGLFLLGPQMAKSYPDPLGRNRVEFANWFLVFGPAHFHLDRAFLVPMLHAWTDPSPRRCQREI
jgi:hypothetical protein